MQDVEAAREEACADTTVVADVEQHEEEELHRGEAHACAELRARNA